MQQLWRAGALRVMAAALLVVALGAAAPGGFALQASVPASGDAVVVVRTDGCNQPEKAHVWGTAEGLVAGERRTIRLKLRRIRAGVYEVGRQWPADGTWVLAVTGTYRKYTSTLLIETDGGALRLADGEIQMRRLRREASKADVEGALRQALAHAGP